VHGNQTLNTIYVTEDRPDSFLAKMGSDLGAQPGDTVCFGHTHKPWTRVVGGLSFVNTGSVGRPKDGDPRSCYVVVSVDGETTQPEFVRVAYDVDEAVRGICASGLPDEFGEVLRSGGAVTATTRS
ncbi:MAG TPA: metallophosphoesterase family protein, partial [Gemmatimonadaceae bacterium]|nr:metallophosphoesterase family protein [Gemmatimonadaceae bacterium]